MLRFVGFLLALLAGPAIAQTGTPGGGPPAYASPSCPTCDATVTAVVYDATTGSIDEIVTPVHDSQLNGPMAPSLTIPNGIVVYVRNDQIQALGFVAALNAVAPNVSTLQAQQAAALVAQGLQAAQPGGGQ